MAMDYHLSWIAAAIYLHAHPECSFPIRNEGEIQQNQEDVDLLVAFEAGAETHLVFIEAKGVTSQSNSQLMSKADRLRQMFGDDGQRWPGVWPHFAIVSPGRPVRVKWGEWPGWRLHDGQPGVKGRNWRAIRIAPERRHNTAQKGGVVGAVKELG
jgi:hypothetical protein